MGSMAFRWAPGLADAALPFALGSFEFLAVRNAGSVFWWCVCSTGFVLAAVLSYTNQYRSAARHAENAALLQRLSRMRRLNVLLMGLGGVWYAGLALVARGSARAQNVAAFCTLVPLVLFLIRSPFNRRAILGGRGLSPISGDIRDAAH
jgi:hypothetical protein